MDEIASLPLVNRNDKRKKPSQGQNIRNIFILFLRQKTTILENSQDFFRIDCKIVKLKIE